ncbi:mycofactocin oligosaccharide methyltransferase MftM [Gordonia sp. CPCC 205515]|uniref:mycofactocin oligosaccharide methyltransferase MftM n=1 Tax=Gordonia sp. CPCC 205515 TaxID=3140791 RepID=UPI003AF34C7A
MSTIESARPPRQIVVRRSSSAGCPPPERAVTWSREDDVLEISHTLDTSSISDSTMIDAITPLVLSGVLAGQNAFETAAVQVIASSGDTAEQGWAAFYDNSVGELRAGGSPFSPIHRRARSLVRGTILEVGCCFGFLALQFTEDGHPVSACDITPGAIEHLTRHALRRGTPVNAVVGDATDLPFLDNSVDTVTLIHLLEHLEEDAAIQAIGEALRVARELVVVAVPFEDQPSEHYGHLLRLTESDLHRWASRVEHDGAEVFTDHGGWLVLTPA